MQLNAEDFIHVGMSVDESETLAGKPMTYLQDAWRRFRKNKVALAAAAGDYKTFTRAQGVGPKLAQRIVLELKDKVGKLQASAGFSPAEAGPVSASGNAAQAVDALAVLGFTPGEVSAAVGRLDSSLPVETLVREALKAMAKKR